VQLGGRPTGPVTATYSWSPASGLSSVSDSVPFASPLVTTTCFLCVTDPFGCINYDTVEVAVNPLPTVISSADTSVCKGSNLQLNASGAVSYSWRPTAGLNDPQIANPIANPERSTNYVVFGTDANGCIDTDTTFVRVFNIDFEPNDTSVCFGDSIQLSVEVDVDDPSTLSYVWSPSSGLSNTNIESPMASPLVTTKYQVRVIDPRGCQDVDSVLVRVLTTPVAAFDYLVSPRCEDAVLELTNNSTSTDEFIWKLNGIPRSNEFEPRFELDYTVENTISLIGSNAACSDSTFLNIPAQTFDEIFKFKDANVFTPNGDGINDIFNPGFEGEFVGCVEFLVFDRWGDKMFDSNIGQYGWDGRSMKGGAAPVGTYFYIVRIGKREIRGSVYLQR
jgi:gliding motility-associated-like protein